ncbi:11247_t:CDS:2 [Gigaspora margarita]|uniref:11247_t:CDS:1 n=1 Tax=Gigaspora margarita TaxID=4874 RepID=A0ABN7V2Q5_GIGMA|nr:11247_t:CDS:2 [Gigaspora margarita]
MSILLKRLFYHSLHKDLSMALIPGMEFRDSRAQAFVFDRGGNVELSTVENIVDLFKLQKDGDLDFNSFPNEIRQEFDIAYMQLEFGENNTDIIDYGSYGMAENIPYDEITHIRQNHLKSQHIIQNLKTKLKSK